MSFRSKQSQLTALIALFSLLLLGGCSMLSREDAPSDGKVTPKHQTLYGWRTLDGGFEGGNLTGLKYVRFVRPVQVAARGNFVFVVDAGSQLLYRYDLSSDQLKVVMDLKGVTAGEVSDIYVYQDHSLLLVDPDSARVLHFNSNGQLIRVIEDSLNLIRPVAVTYDEQMGRLLIADGSSDDILVFTSTGQLQGVIGARGLSDGQFLNITAITTGGAGIYVTARLGHRVQVMGRDGTHVDTFQPDTVVFPLAVAVDRGLNAFVSDYLDNSIKVFRDGLFLESIGGSGSGPGRFKLISDLWYDGGFLYAVDSLNGRVQILRVEMVEAKVPGERADEVVAVGASAVPLPEELEGMVTEVEGDNTSASEEKASELVPLNERQSPQQGLKATQDELEELQTELENARAELEAAKEKQEGKAQLPDAPQPAPSQMDATPDLNSQE